MHLSGLCRWFIVAEPFTYHARRQPAAKLSLCCSGDCDYHSLDA